MIRFGDKHVRGFLTNKKSLLLLAGDRLLGALTFVRFTALQTQCGVLLVIRALMKHAHYFSTSRTPVFR